MNKKHYFIIFFLLTSIQIKAQNVHIKGMTVDINKSPIADVHIVLYDIKDSTKIIKATTTNEKGSFTLSKIPHSNYKLSAYNIGYNKAHIQIGNLLENIDHLQITMNEKYIKLGETIITAKRIINEFDKQIIFPNEFEKNNSMDGVELIDKIRLPGIIVDMANNSIKGMRGGAVQLRVNGARADLNDVRGIDPKLVTRVEYHDMPSMRYGDAEAVVDLYVKRRESGGSAKLFTYNSVTSKNGTESGSIKINHQKSEFFLWGGHSYAHFDNNYDTQTTMYNFENDKTLVRHEEGFPSRNHENIYNGGLSYSYLTPGNTQFTAKLSYSFYGTPDSGTGNGRIYVEGKPEINKQSFTIYQDKAPRLSLYYQKNLKNKQLIAFEVMGANVYTDSYRSYKETQEGSNITEILSDIDGNSYSAVIEGIYEKQFKKNAKISAGLKQNLNFANIVYQGTSNSKSKMDLYTTNAYTEWSAKIKSFNYAAGIRGVFNRTIQQASNNSSFNFSPSIRLGYKFNQDIQLRYSGEISVIIPSLKNFNNIELAVDGYLARRGNPDLKSITSYSNSLLFTCYKGDFMTSLNVSNTYSIRPILRSTFRENDKFITQVQNGKKAHNLTVEGSADWSAFGRRLNIYGRVGYCFRKNIAEDYEHSLHTWYCNMGINWTYRDFTLYGSTNKDMNVLTDEIIVYRGQGVTLGLDYKWKKLKIGGGVNWRVGHSYNNRSRSFNRFVISDKYSYTPDGDMMVRIKLSWNINFGRQRESSHQRIENEGGDSAVF